MKRQLSKKTLYQSLLSVITLSIFILLAVGSDHIFYELYPSISIKRNNLGSGVYQETETHMRNKTRIFTGSCDAYERWQGPVVIKWNGKDSYTEEVNMIDGLRDGESKTTFSDGRVVTKLYDKGVYVTQLKSAYNNMADNSAFNILTTKYPWFFFTLNVFDFNDAYIEAYMNTVEIRLSAPVFEPAEFDFYYGDIVEEFMDTPYDSIISVNSELTLCQAPEKLKNDELRMAIIDRYRSNGNWTFNIISTSYPGYLHALNDSGIVNQDFKDFCQDVDNRMTSYGALNLQDPFFIDSVDARIFRALSAILDAGKSFSLSAEPSMISIARHYKKSDLRGIYGEVRSILKPSFSKSTSSEVGLVVVSIMLQQYTGADMFMQAFKEAWFIKKGVNRVPTVTTAYVGNNSATSASLKGNVIEDGGAAVTSRGIAWATFYNPTTNDNKAAPGTGTGSFPATITGLTAGTSYYARTYATNIAGTAYGNCISFYANITTGFNDTKIFRRDFTIYPNPASEFATFRFLPESSGSMVLTITDMNGQLVLEKNLDNLPQGENQIKLNVSGFHNGLYACQLKMGTTKITRNLVISH